MKQEDFEMEIVAKIARMHGDIAEFIFAMNARMIELERRVELEISAKQDLERLRGYLKTYEPDVLSKYQAKKLARVKSSLDEQLGIDTISPNQE